MTASLNERFKNVEWGEYRIGDLFKKLKVKKAIKAEVRNYYNSEFCVPVVYCKYGDNGIMYWGRKNEFTTYRNVISVVYNGVIAAGKVYAQKDETGILAESYFISLKDHKASHRVNLFLACSLEKVLYHKYSRDYLATWNGRVENDKVFLPVSNGKIDYLFMETVIAELEEERVAELSAYLTVSGLDNYELSKEEEQALQHYDDIPFEEFDVTSVFDVKNTSNLLSEQIIEGSGTTPYLCASAENNGVSSYISFDKKYLESGHCVFIGGKTFVVTYQESDFYSNDSHNLALHLLGYNANKLEYLYLATCVYKSLSHKYSWGNSISKTKIKKDRINLPSKDGKPDYESMELLISAIQKLVIKDVVLYAERKNDTAKQFIGN